MAPKKVLPSKAALTIDEACRRYREALGTPLELASLAYLSDVVEKVKRGEIW